MMNVFEKIKDRLKQRLLANDECRKTALSKHNFDSVKYFQSLMFEDETIISIIQEQAEAYNSGWISCSERLPEEYGEYLCCDKYGEYIIGFPIERVSSDDFYVETEHEIMNDCIAWMPLPEPYKESDTNGN